MTKGRTCELQAARGILWHQLGAGRSQHKLDGELRVGLQLLYLRHDRRQHCNEPQSCNRS